MNQNTYKNKTRYKSLDKLAADPRVREIWDEGTDGIWLLLADDWTWWDTSCVHEWTVRDLKESFKQIEQRSKRHS